MSLFWNEKNKIKIKNCFLINRGRKYTRIQPEGKLSNYARKSNYGNWRWFIFMTRYRLFIIRCEIRIKVFRQVFQGVSHYHCWKINGSCCFWPPVWFRQRISPQYLLFYHHLPTGIFMVSIWPQAIAKVGCIFPMVIVSVLSCAEFRPNNPRKDAHYYLTESPATNCL